MVEEAVAEVEEFDPAAYAREQGWDPAAVCSLTDRRAQLAIAAFMVSAAASVEEGDVEDAKACVDCALRAVKTEQDAGRTKQAEREAKKYLEKGVVE